MSERVSTYTGVTDDNPVPRTSRIGNLVFSSMITGRDPKTRRLPTDLAAQTAFLFWHVRELVEGAGGTVDRIVKLDLWMADRNAREALDAEWLKMFPRAESRPARHTRQADLGEGQLILATFVAVL